jgi:hypothetical protein
MQYQIQVKTPPLLFPESPGAWIIIPRDLPACSIHILTKITCFHALAVQMYFAGIHCVRGNYVDRKNIEQSIV